MVYLSEILLLGLAALVADYQAYLIEHGKPIYHKAWFAVWCVLTCLAMWWIWPELHRPPIWAEEMSGDIIPWIYAVAAGCGHLVVFNMCLNRFRGLPWTYTSISTGSIIDRLELRLWGSRFWVVEVILGVLWIALQFFFL